LKKLLLIILLFSSGKSFAQWTLDDFRPLHNLFGSWVFETKKGKLHESWSKTSDSTMNGYSYLISPTDSIPQETVELWYLNGKITYTPTTVSQNEGNPVVFALIKIDSGQYIFENKQHDFPNQIRYKLVDMNTVHASIAGNIQGTWKEIPFYFKRKKI
jgi:hypothetical protein